MTNRIPFFEYGIDISKYQKPSKMNYRELPWNNKYFAILRAGYGKYKHQKDSAFERHYNNLSAVGVGFGIGAYHYSCALSVADAIKEADCFLTWIDGKRLTYPVAYDVEYQPQKNLDRKLVTEIAYTFMHKVESAGYYTMLYVNPNWINNYINIKDLKHFDLWLACYTTLTERFKLYPYNVGIWQYTSHLQIPDVYSSRLDGNIAYKNYQKIIREKGLNNVY